MNTMTHTPSTTSFFSNLSNTLSSYALRTLGWVRNWLLYTYGLLISFLCVTQNIIVFAGMSIGFTLKHFFEFGWQAPVAAATGIGFVTLAGFTLIGSAAPFAGAIMVAAAALILTSGLQLVTMLVGTTIHMLEHLRKGGLL